MLKRCFRDGYIERTSIFHYNIKNNFVVGLKDYFNIVNVTYGYFIMDSSKCNNIIMVYHTYTIVRDTTIQIPVRNNFGKNDSKAQFNSLIMGHFQFWPYSATGTG